MAEELAASEAPKQSTKGGGGSGFMIPALLVIVLTPLFSFVMLKFMAIPMLMAELPAQGEMAAVSAEDVSYDRSGTEYDFRFKPMVANVKGTIKTRYVQADLTVYSQNPELQRLMDGKLGRLQDHANTTFSNLTLADYEKQEIKSVLRSSLKEGFNHLLGSPVVEDISMTLVIQ